MSHTLNKTQLKQQLGIKTSQALKRICERVGVHYQPGAQIFTHNELIKLLGADQDGNPKIKTNTPPY